MTKEFLVRVRYRPTANHFRLVRLTGWKEKGNRSWRPIGVSMPDCLKKWLNPQPLPTDGGWRICAPLGMLERRKFLKAMKKGGVVDSGPLECEAHRGCFTPIMDHVTHGTRQKLERIYKRAIRFPRPAITLPPEPTDFFPKVRKMVRAFYLPQQVDGVWHEMRILRTGSVEAPWRVAIDNPHAEESPAYAWVYAGGRENLEAWEHIRPRVTYAWEETLTQLGYRLWCMREGQDPLDKWPRFRGEVKSQTLAHCLNEAKEYGSRVWHLRNRTEESWNWI